MRTDTVRRHAECSNRKRSRTDSLYGRKDYGKAWEGRSSWACHRNKGRGCKPEIQDHRNELVRCPDDVYSSQVLVFPVRDVKMGFRVLELRETEIDDFDLITMFADSHEEVVGLDVPANEVSRMDVLDTGDL